mmetsp:Transcript_6269/g.10571  ORF Transcript_6269/g.10571 Transcript_6269/m.10571 type:complete len:212 (-) Transcript_6269:1591-2226(-)
MLCLSHNTLDPHCRGRGPLLRPLGFVTTTYTEDERRRRLGPAIVRIPFDGGVRSSREPLSKALEAPINSVLSHATERRDKVVIVLVVHDEAVMQREGEQAPFAPPLGVCLHPVEVAVVHAALVITRLACINPNFCVLGTRAMPRLGGQPVWRRRRSTLRKLNRKLIARRHRRQVTGLIYLCCGWCKHVLQRLGTCVRDSDNGSSFGTNGRR